MIKFIKQGFTKEVSSPKFGQQNIGVSPSGAMDLFSMQTANMMIGKDRDASATEIIFSPTIEFTTDCTFIITGADRDTTLNGDKIERAKVIVANEGDVLVFGETNLGFRTYLAVKEGKDYSREGRTRKCFYLLGDKWIDKDHCIRVVEGPEYSTMTNPEAVIGSLWTVGIQNDMGMKLDGTKVEQNEISMVSSPVANGTVQLTPSGPIVLLKNRQTVGGYPRVLNVISADVDMLAQYHTGNVLRFKMVSMDEAVRVAKEKAITLNSFITELESEEY